MNRLVQTAIGLVLMLTLTSSCVSKRKDKIDIYTIKKEEHPILVMGFHSIGGSKEQVWQNYAASYFVAEDLRLNAGDKIWLDPIVLRNFFPAFDSRLYSSMPSDDNLKYLCDLFKCESGYYVVWEDGVGGDREIRVYQFTTSVVRLDAMQRVSPEDLVSAQRFIVETILKSVLGISEVTLFESKGMIPKNRQAMRQAVMGLYFSDTGWYNKALEFFRSAVASDPGYEYARLKIGEILLAKDEAEEALTYLIPIQSRFAEEPYYLYLLARAYFYAGKTTEAEKTIDECLTLAPDYQEALMLQAIIKGKAGKRRAERFAVGRFLRSNPRTGAQLAQAERLIQRFSRSSAVTVLTNRLATLQVYDPFFGEIPREIYNRVKYSTEWSLGRLGRDIRRPGNIVAIPEGLAVWDNTARAILLLGEDGVIRSELMNAAFIEVEGIAFAPPGSVYLADPVAGAVFRVNLNDGTVSVVTKEIPRPRGVAVLGQNLYVTDAVNDTIWVLSPSGSLLRKISILTRGLNKEASPGLIIGTPSGTLVYEDDLLNRIVEITPEGRVLRKIASSGFGPDEILKPVGLTRTTNGQIFVTDWGDHQVKIFNPDGSIYAVFGGPGALSGEFNRPSGVVQLRDGRILVTDQENGRIQIFRVD